ncbi:MAG: 30S ribosomal protein S15 [Candidatus Heimdallarchaeota archaeon]|nr:30S ribosomal protein S15 [Candidatus Heimdallarchaeota archaeon]MDH5645501.1 30S ribosomal protein S15 [Candidatus Heimdallarchaeota archaeon]
MARMHSRKKGKAGSTKPYLTNPPSWVPLPAAEVEKLVVQLYKQGNSQAHIGLILKDQYGVPSIKLVTGKKLLTILQDNEVAPRYPEDLISLIRRAMNLRNHLTENKKDFSGANGLDRIEAKIYRLSAYYRKEGVLPSDWRYRPANASVLLR